MNNWFTVKVKYTKQLHNGTFKHVTEPYLLAAMTFTDAEARIYKELGTAIRGEFLVTAITRTDVHDIFQYDESDSWFKCKVKYDKMDEEGNIKKSVTNIFLVSADTVQEANQRLVESLSTLMIDYRIQSVVQDPLIDIFPYEPTKDQDHINI